MNLSALHRTYGFPTDDEIWWLLQRGVTEDALTSSWSVTATSARFEDKGFCADPDGERALIFRAEDRGEPIDLIAWQPRSNKLATLLGVGFCIGDLEQTFCPSSWFAGGGLHIHRSPLEWLLAERRGIVIAQPRYVHAYLKNCPRLICTDHALASDLNNWLKPPRRTAKIFIRTDTQKDVAMDDDNVVEFKPGNSKLGESNPTPMRPHWCVESWPQPVSARELVEQLAARIKRHVVMSDDAALAVALWIMFAWVHDGAVHSPLLLVSSPEAECGKTTLLGLVALLVPRGFVFVDISAPVLYRMIEKWHPTLIVDEADTTFKNNPELRAVVNSGWTRGSGVPRCHPKTHEPEFFETFGPKAIGLKGLAIPDTTLSRSIVIEMQRKLPNEGADDFAHGDDEHLAHLRRLLSRFADDNIERLRTCSPCLPEGFNNRLAANWRLLLAIAELSGVAAEARAAAVALSRRTDEASLGVELLRDIRDIRDATGPDRIRSEKLVETLGAMADRPWAEMPYTGKPITQAQLAKLLRAYKVRPKDIRFGDSIFKGYEFAWFESAFRYIPSEHPQNSRNRATNADFGQKCRNKADDDVAAKMADSGQCCGVAPDLGVRADDPFECLKSDAWRLSG
jgi:hypothetical protein